MTEVELEAPPPQLGARAKAPPPGGTDLGWALWSGPLFIAVFFGGVLIAGWLPPPSANDSAQAVATMYREHTDSIRLGALLIGAASMFQGVWTALMSVQLRRIEGTGRLWTYAQLAAGAVGILVVIIPAFAFAAAAFQPDRDPEITQALHQFGWLCLVGVGWPSMLQALSVGIAVLGDRSERPVFPRWFGWFNLWMTFGFLPGPCLIFFHTGAFAWNGAAVFWFPAAAFGAFFATWFYVLRRAVADQAAGS